ncbi:MAG: Fpg/Nei family DNA glycosylase [Actinobacteria bacterium]|nr:Fpg/Nei family DNA glycosylase [Actinomycetota bacterium]
MPEGDTIRALATRLHAALSGERLLRTDFRVPRLATVDLGGQRVAEVDARGKHLLVRTGAGLTVRSHLRMDGAWRLHRPGASWRRDPRHEVRAVLVTAPWVAVGVRLPVLDVLPTSREADVLGHLGPDVLGPDWDPGEVLRRLRAGPGRPIGEALVDQTVMAGPGNVYRSEACFLRGVDPMTPVGEVRDLEGMVLMVKRLMEANRAGGTQVTTGDPRPGRRHWVYGRGGEPCRRCGTPVVREVDPAPGGLSGRVTYRCPSCQPPVDGATSA